MSSKRDRELARAKWERQQARRTARAQRDSVIRRSVFAGLVVVVLVGLIVNQQAKTKDSATPTSTQTALSLTPGPNDPKCSQVNDLQTSAAQFAKPLSDGTPGKNLTLNTNCGAINIELDVKAPMTSTIIGNLAKAGYFNKTACHRLTTSGIYVLQCGDPTGTGTGSPGFKFADENLPQTTDGAPYTYPRGTVAMANSGPNTNGSQFFLVYGDSPLPPNYSVWGKITSGLELVDKVAATGVIDGGSDGKPKTNIVVLKADVS